MQQFSGATTSKYQPPDSLRILEWFDGKNIRAVEPEKATLELKQLGKFNAYVPCGYLLEDDAIQISKLVATRVRAILASKGCDPDIVTSATVEKINTIDGTPLWCPFIYSRPSSFPDRIEELLTGSPDPLAKKLGEVLKIVKQVEHTSIRGRIQVCAAKSWAPEEIQFVDPTALLDHLSMNIKVAIGNAINNGTFSAWGFRLNGEVMLYKSR